MFLALDKNRMDTVTHLIPLLTLDGFRGVIFTTMRKLNWDDTMELMRPRPSLQNDPVFVRAVCDTFVLKCPTQLQ